MAYSDHANVTPNNAVSRVSRSIDNAWRSVTHAFYEDIEHPQAAIQRTGDFAVSAFNAARDQQRDAWGAAYGSMNRLIRTVRGPCGKGWWMIVETALPAAGDALWAFVVPSPSQVLENYLRPDHGGKFRRGYQEHEARDRADSRSGRKRRRFRGIPDVDEVTADALPGAAAIRGRNTGKLTEWAFRGIAVNDAAGLSMMIADATDTFYSEWTSGLMPQGRFCDKSFNVIYAGSQIGTVQTDIFRPNNTVMQDERALHMEWQGTELTLITLGGLEAQLTTLFQVTIQNTDKNNWAYGTHGLIRGFSEGLVTRDFGDIPPLGSLSVTMQGSGVVPVRLAYQVSFVRAPHATPEFSSATVDVAGHSPPPQ